MESVKRRIHFITFSLLVVVFSCNDESNFVSSISELPTENNYYTMDFIDHRTGWVAGSSGTILKTTDGGRSWIDQSVNSNETFYDIQFLSQTEGWIASSYNLYSTTDGGNSWKVHYLIGDLDRFVKICFVSLATGWINSSENGVLYKTTNYGSTWEKQIVDETNIPIFDLSFISATEGFCTSRFGSIYFTSNGGRNWEKVSNPRFTQDIEFLSSKVGFAGNNIMLSSYAPDYPTLYKTTNGGADWTEIYRFDGEIIWEVKFLDSRIGIVILGGICGYENDEPGFIQCGNVFGTKNGGITWTQLGTSASVVAVDIVNGGIACLLNTNYELSMLSIR